MTERFDTPWMKPLLRASVGKDVDMAFDVLLGVVQQARTSGDISECETLLCWIQRPEVLQALHVEILLSVIRLTSNMRAALPSWSRTVAAVGQELDRRPSTNRRTLLWGLEDIRFFNIVEERPLMYTAQYEHDALSGTVWYNVETSETGPEDAPDLVRLRLRREVHRLLTDVGTHARAIVDLHE